MLRLLRNCPHRNEVATFYHEENQEKKIIKASSFQTGIEQIKRELNGWNWYQSRRYPNYKRNICTTLKSSENYIKISIKYIEGCQGRYSKGIRKNSVLISQFIDHYCNIWHGYRENEFPLHGDLSVDNLITNKNGIHIIDWEHFSLYAAPFGFDAYNLLFEQLFFSIYRKKRIKRNELNYFLKNIRRIRSSSTESNLLYNRPLSSVRKFIKVNSIFWNNQIYRLPILHFTEEQVRTIDRKIELEL